MSEYIEREKAIMYAHNALPFNPNECEKLEEVLRMMPSDDVAPVVHGEWIRHRNILWHYCSVCLEDALMSRSTGVEVLSDVCPHCGAKMDGEE